MKPAMPRMEEREPALAQPAKKSWFSLEGRDLEMIIGGNWFSRIGILAIILSVGFFLKYAFENQWIGPAGRVMIGVLLGLGFLGGGERLRGKGYRYYAHGLSGGGIAILYLAFFAAFSRYQLIGQVPAFALMSMVTAAAVLLAARYDALAIAVLGLIGGFLTPIMLSTGRDNQVGLFSYIALLDLGVLAVAWFKQWRVLHYLAYIATALMSAAWLEEWYEPAKLWTTIFFFTLLFVIFALLAVLHNIVNRMPVKWPDIGLVQVNALLYFATSYNLLEPEHQPWLGLFAVAVSAFYLALGYWTYSRDREDRYLVLTFLGLAALFLTLAIPIQMSRHWVTMAWALEGVALTWIGLRTESRLTRYAAVVVSVIAAWHWLTIDLGEFAFRGQGEFIPLFNRRAVSCVMLIACLAGVAWLYSRRGEKVEAGERKLLAGAALLASLFFGILWLSLDGRDYFEQAKAPLLALVADEPGQWEAIGRLDSHKHLLLTALWCVYSGAMALIGFAKRVPLLRWAAMPLLALAAAKALLYDARYYAAPGRLLVFNPVFAAFAILTATMAVLYWQYGRARLARQPGEDDAGKAGEWETIPPVLLAGANLFALIGLSLEVNGYFTAKLAVEEAERAAAVAGLRRVMLTLLWSLYGAASLRIAFQRGIRWLRIGSLGVVLLAAVKVLFVDLPHAVAGRAPLLNATFASFLIVIAALGYCYWQYSRAEGIAENLHARIVSGLLILIHLLALFALSVESEGYFSAVMRPLEHESSAWRDAILARQLWLSVIWAVYSGGMLVAGLWRRNRLLRWMALLLLGVTIVKVFLVDLSSLDQIYRVISFVVLGAILLAVSFLYQRAQKRLAGGGE